MKARLNAAARIAALAVAAATTLATVTGCALPRGQTTVGEFIDDTAITTKVKARFAEARTVDASAISVETLDGEVVLSGFAKSAAEKADAEALARDVKGVKAVKNAIVLRN